MKPFLPFALFALLPMFCGPAFAAGEGARSAAPAARVALMENAPGKAVRAGENKTAAARPRAGLPRVASRTAPGAAPRAATAPAAAVPAFTSQNYVGEIKTYKARPEDTLLSIGEKYDLGYVELRSANPAMDPWRPGNGTFIILPTMHLLPDAPRRGIIVNLSEMRLYYFSRNGVKTFPIGVGREGFSTPTGTTAVTRKVNGPIWRPTDRMRREDPSLPVQVGPGPDNPLGTHALYLGWPQYLLHGTNKPWGIGRRVSSGCVRMYNESAKELYDTVAVGTPVTVVRQNVKIAWIGSMLYMEAHPDEMLADQVERAGSTLDYKVPNDIFARLSNVAGAQRDRIDWKAVREVLKDRRGYPQPILAGAQDKDRFVTASMETRAGTSRYGPRLTAESAEPVPLTQAQAKPDAADDGKAPAPARRRMGGFNG